MGFCFFASELEVLWYGGHGSSGIDLNIFSKSRAIPDHGIRTDPAAIIDDNIFLNCGEGLDGNIVTNFSLGVNVC
jgi:hypothetical protein